MQVLENVQPSDVLYFFEVICSIPHGSGNEKAISDYLYAFAAERNLWVKQDEHLNIIIKKPGTAGRENAMPVILQAHMDMVCEKNQGTEHDFEKDPLKLVIDGDLIRAEGTTLGADNGIAVAMALALLDGDHYVHPPLEVVFTSNEEVGLCGARDLDASILSGRRLINIDSEEEGYFCTSCAGGLKTHMHVPVETVSPDPAVASVFLELQVRGLMGGHSGMEIDKGRGNSIRILGRILKSLRRDYGLQVAWFRGGMRDNAIPREAEAGILVTASQVDGLEKSVKEMEGILMQEFRISDPGVRLNLSKVDHPPQAVYSDSCLDRILGAALLLPDGIMAMSTDIPNLVETSCNLGVAALHENEIEFISAVRSSVMSRKYMVRDQILACADLVGASVDCRGDYPGWEYAPVSPLRDVFCKSFAVLYNRPPEIMAIHAGLECGYFAQKLPGIDMISLGPDIQGAHTPDENLSISSLNRTWKLLLHALAEM